MKKLLLSMFAVLALMGAVNSSAVAYPEHHHGYPPIHRPHHRCFNQLVPVRVWVATSPWTGYWAVTGQWRLVCY